MKGGVAIALGVIRALAASPEQFAELSLITVVDEEWRTGGFDHGQAFAGYDACLCFEAGQLAPGGGEAVVAKRKAAGDPAGRSPTGSPPTPGPRPRRAATRCSRSARWRAGWRRSTTPTGRSA